MRRVVICTLAMLACRPPAAKPPAQTLTDTAVVPLAGGESTMLRTIGGGRPMVVDFYATWCKSCRKQIAGLEQLATRHGDRLVVVGIDVGEELEIASAFVVREGIDYQTFGDPDFELAGSMGVTQLPALLLIDRDGAIVHRTSHLDDELLTRIDALVGSPSASAHQALR